MSFFHFIGFRNKLIDDSVISTKWFCIIIPIFPLSSFRLWLNVKPQKFLYFLKTKNTIKQSIQIPLDLINVFFVYSMYTALGIILISFFNNQTLIIISIILFIILYGIFFLFKYYERDLFEIDKEKKFECTKCHSQFHILKLNIAHGYFVCPKCNEINDI